MLISTYMMPSCLWSTVVVHPCSKLAQPSSPVRGAGEPGSSSLRVGSTVAMAKVRASLQGQEIIHDEVQPVLFEPEGRHQAARLDRLRIVNPIGASSPACFRSCPTAIVVRLIRCVRSGA